MATRFMLGLFDDGKGSFVGCVDFGNWILRNRVPHYEHDEFTPGGFTYDFDRVYELLIRQDEERTLFATADEEERMKIHAAERHRGAMFLWFHTQCYILVHSLRIEGALLPDSTAELRELWVDARMAELGFE
jgi:hypothetical protein